MSRFLWGVAALEVYLGLYRLARPVGAGSDRAAYPFYGNPFPGYDP